MVKEIIKNPIYYVIGIFVLVAFNIGIVLRNGLVVFLGWNLILAGMVSFFADSYRVLYLKGYKRLSIIPFILFILFFPNSVYVLTDFIHLQVYEFFKVYPSVYLYEISHWLVFGIITIGALIACKSGISALDRMKDVSYPFISRFYVLYVGLLFLASSVAIYIGRFIRFNSWDILKVFSIIPQFFQNFSFFISFVGIMWVVHVVIYSLLSKKAFQIIGGKA